MLEHDDGLTIPTPPGALLLGFCALSGKCLGIIVGWADARYRDLPAGSLCAKAIRLFDGQYEFYRVPSRIECKWYL